MIRKHVSNKVGLPKIPITWSLLEFFRRATNLLGCDVVIDSGIVSILSESSEADNSLKDEIGEYDRVLSELLFSGIVDNFQNYLTDLLLEILKAEPRIISSGSIKNNVIFDQPDLDSLKRYIIDRHVVNLGYKRIDELNEYFREVLKFPLTVSRFQELRLSRIVQIRNIIAHNRGRISQVFLQRVGAKADIEGEQANMPNIYAVRNFLFRVATGLDTAAANKYSLRLIPTE